MKLKVFLFAAIGLLSVTTVGCSKEKSCRCGVLNKSTVRIITIQSGDCEGLHLFHYHTVLDSLRIDSLLCTDYEFAIDQKD